MIFALGSTVSTLLIAHQRDLADARAREADDNAAEAIGRLYISDMRLAQRAWEDNEIGRLLELLEGQRPERTGGKDLRGFEWHYWWRLSHSHLLILRGHQGPVSCVAYSPDGKRIVGRSGDNTVKVWDADTGQKILTLKHDASAFSSLAYSPDGKWIVSGNHDNSLTVWDAETGLKIRTIKGHNNPVWCVAFSPDGKRIASGSDDLTIKIWDATPPGEKPPVAAAPVLAQETTADAAEIERLIGLLGRDKFTDREVASKRLESIGEPALPALRKAVGSNRDAEVRRRAELLVQAINQRSSERK